MNPDEDMMRLGAYVDGELSDAERADVRAQLEGSAEDSLTVSQIREMNLRLSLAFAAPMNEPIPDALRDIVLGADDSSRLSGVMPGFLRNWQTLAGAGVAALIALAVGLGLGSQVFSPSSEARVAFADPALSKLLETGATGDVLDQARVDVAVMSTFFDEAGRPCRELEQVDLEARSLSRAIACRSNGAWGIEFLAAQPSPQIEGRQTYVAASGSGEDLLGSALDVLGAGMALGPEEVSALIKKGWSTD